MNRSNGLQGMVISAALMCLGTGAVLAQPASPPLPLTVIAEIDAKPEYAAQIRARMVPLAAAARSEAGCLSYVLYEDRRTPGHFFTYETWQDDAALDAHLSSPAMKAGAIKLGPLLERPPIITRLGPL